jgi:hypothetical protein
MKCKLLIRNNKYWRMINGGIEIRLKEAVTAYFKVYTDV